MKKRIKKRYQDKIPSFILDHVTTKISYWDDQLVCRYMNVELALFFQKSPNEFIHKITLPMLLNEQYEEVEPYVRGAFAGEKQRFERVFKKNSGEHVNILLNYTPDIVKGKVKGMFVDITDITELRKKELEQQRIQKELQQAHEIGKIGVWEIDYVNKTIFWSDICKKIHGVDSDFQPTFENLPTFYKPRKDKYGVAEMIVEHFTNGSPFDEEALLLNKDGQERWIRIIGQFTIEKSEITAVKGIVQDIDEMKRNQLNKDQANSELNNILNATNVCIISTGTDGLITHFGKGSEQLLQYSAEELIGKKSPALFHVEAELVEQNRELSLKYNRQLSFHESVTIDAIENGSDCREWTFVRKDGSHFPVQMVVSTRKNDENELIGFVGYATDITALKKAEQDLKNVLHLTQNQNDRLKSFTEIVSHNLQSHASNIQLIVDLHTELNSNSSDQTQLKMLKQASENLNTALANLNEVLNINTTFSDHFESINLHQAVEQAKQHLTLIGNPSGIKLINDIPKDYTLSTLPAYLDSILQNFITNGNKYKSEDRESFIQFQLEESENEFKLIVRDNGLGIDLTKHGKNLFGMYKTFHGNEYARGIGLYITKNQIEALGGQISVESEENSGTTFIVTFKKQ